MKQLENSSWGIISWYTGSAKVFSVQVGAQRVCNESKGD